MMEREGSGDWVSHSKTENKGLFSELDILLRGLDRFFNIENLTLSAEELSTKNFHDEVVMARDTILRILGILEVVIPESRKNAYWFQRFTETKYLSERTKDAFREELYRQDTPEKGLYLLFDSFVNLKGIITDLLRSGSISYLGFSNIGNFISKEIRENVFFNPFRKSLNPEFDVISNAAIAEIVRSIPNKEERKFVSLIYLGLFRLLRILGFVEISTQRSVSLNSSLVVLILLRSEITAFRSHIEKAIAKIRHAELAMLLQAVSYQFSMETKRVFLQELKDIHRRKASIQLRGKIENSHGIIKNLAEQGAVQLTQFYSPGIKGEEIFSSFTTKLGQSLRLREDVFVLHQFISLLEDAAAEPEKRARVFDSLRSYMLYFESFTFRLLRYDDYEEFAQFFGELNTVRRETILSTEFHKILEKALHFKIFLETTLRHLANRSELSGKDIEMERVNSLMSQYF